eukprot:78231-Hanusia_phi.AAC.2
MSSSSLLPPLLSPPLLLLSFSRSPWLLLFSTLLHLSFSSSSDTGGQLYKIDPDTLDLWTSAMRKILSVAAASLWLLRFPSIAVRSSSTCWPSSPSSPRADLAIDQGAEETRHRETTRALLRLFLSLSRCLVCNISVKKLVRCSKIEFCWCCELSDLFSDLTSGRSF